MAVFRRRIIREKVLQVLYAYELSKEPLVLIEEQLLDELTHYNHEFTFAKDLINRVVQHEAELDAIIRSKALHWEFDRIAIIDRLLLRMGICELMYFPDIPPKVTINEVIEIGKEFSTSKSGPFLNGILDAIHNELKNTSSLHKSGRGLISESAGEDEEPENRRTATGGSGSPAPKKLIVKRKNRNNPAKGS